MPARGSAVAIFVKTPGLSPLKTRLAEVVGRETAESFHRLSAAAVGAVVRAAAPAVPLTPYWAVAERDGLAHPLWSEFDRLPQGEGGLGARLCHVYDALRARHHAVLLIGADSPQMTPAILTAAAERLSRGAHGTRFVLGRSHDGGFYLFGGNAPVPRGVWQSVPYSTGTTAAELVRQLQPLGSIHDLPPLTDVDVVADLKPLAAALSALRSPLPEQSALRHWLEPVLAGLGRGTADAPAVR